METGSQVMGPWLPGSISSPDASGSVLYTSNYSSSSSRLCFFFFFSLSLSLPGSICKYTGVEHLIVSAGFPYTRWVLTRYMGELSGSGPISGRFRWRDCRAKLNDSPQKRESRSGESKCFLVSARAFGLASVTGLLFITREDVCVYV